jgi:hypothetical protein
MKRRQPIYAKLGAILKKGDTTAFTPLSEI